MEVQNVAALDIYKIEKRIGVGGMSYVYKAYDKKMKREVAVKVLKEENAKDPEVVAKFQREAESYAKLSHPNIVKAYDVIDDGDLHCIILEFVEGRTLKQYIIEKSKLTNEETVDLAIQIAKGLEHAHNQGIIHRDIKPQNVIINRKHLAKVSDFGIARAIGQATITTQAMGSIHYLSPEQAENDNVDIRSDIYSLGCTMYEMITGKVPFDADSIPNIILAHMKDSINKPSKDNENIYPSLEKIILKCTQRDPDLRYQNAKELIQDLKKALKKKDGEYITINKNAEKEEDGTIVITGKTRQAIKVWKNSNDKHDTTTITSKVKNEFINKHTKKQEKNHLPKYLIAIFAIIFLIIIVMGYNLYSFSKKNKEMAKTLETTGQRQNIEVNVESDSRIVIDLKGVNIDAAREVTKPYNITFNIKESRFDRAENGTILEVNGKAFEKGSVIDVVISKGPKVLDFTNKSWLNALTKADIEYMLKDRGIKYYVEEIYDEVIPAGYVISVNKKLSSDPGDTIIFVSKGKENALDNNTESIANTDTNAWTSQLNSTYIVGAGHGPDGTTTDSVTIAVRLKQLVGNEIHYSYLTEAKTYKGGTKIPLVFSTIKGEAGIGEGIIEVVDVVNDEVKYSYNLVFKPQNISLENEKEGGNVIVPSVENEPGVQITKE